jgi:hypothetical protein
MKTEFDNTENEALSIARVSDSASLFRRKGKLIVSRQLILEASEQVLKEIFSNFFPIDADRHHNHNYWDSILYYGISPHFEEVEEACIAPEYEMVFDTDENGNVKFNRFDKRELHYR